MWHCDDCSSYFEDPNFEKDYHYELGYGRFYETYCVCPRCGSSEIYELSKKEERAYRQSEECQ